MNVLDHVKIELSSKCKCACFKCPRTILKGLYDETEISVEYVKQVVELKPKRVVLMGNLGDPIYHSKFPEIIKMFNDHSQPFNVHTVGSGYDKEWWKNVYNLYEDRKRFSNKWTFTLDGLEKTAGKYRVGLNYNEVLDAMCLGAELGKRIAWDFIVLKHNEDDIEKVKTLSDKYGFQLNIHYNDRWHVTDAWKPKKNI